MSFRTKRRFKQGEKGESKAINILKEYGYSILETQPEGKAYMWVDGKMKTLDIRADYLVSKKGIEYICEVKTGKVVGDVTYRHTRRQLLEYFLYFEKPIVFVDVKNKTVTKVEFALPE